MLLRGFPVPLQPAAAAPSLRRYRYRDQSYEKHEETGVGESIGTAQCVLGPRCWDLCLAVSSNIPWSNYYKEQTQSRHVASHGDQTTHWIKMLCDTGTHRHTLSRQLLCHRKISVFGPRNVGFILGGDENVLVNCVPVAQLCEYTRSRWIVHFKWVNFWYVNSSSLKLF